jgi:hypothetical protein
MVLALLWSSVVLALLWSSVAVSLSWRLAMVLAVDVNAVPPLAVCAQVEEEEQELVRVLLSAAVCVRVCARARARE